MLDPEQPTQEDLTHLSIRACRIAFRNIGGYDGETYKHEVARRIQEVWEDEGIDISSLATVVAPGSNDADKYMRVVYRDRKNLPKELHCGYCGAFVEINKAFLTEYCNETCYTEHLDFIKEHGVNNG